MRSVVLTRVSPLLFDILSKPPRCAQTVLIEQMDAEEVSKTFYCRTEYAAFKDAYRTHRDTRDWRRSNDVLPCNCDSCQDDLVQGGTNATSSAWGPPAAAVAEAPAGDNNTSTSIERESSRSPDHPAELDVVLLGASGEVSSMGTSAECTAEEKEEVPPSPVGAIFEGGDEEEVSKTGNGNEGGEGGDGRGGGGACPARRNTWNDGTACRGMTSGGDTHKRGGSWDGGSTSIQQAVEKHGMEYAYKTLRLQGFSDNYIRTHFLPEGSPSPRGGGMR